MPPIRIVLAVFSCIRIRFHGFEYFVRVYDALISPKQRLMIDARYTRPGNQALKIEDLSYTTDPGNFRIFVTLPIFRKYFYLYFFNESLLA